MNQSDAVNSIRDYADNATVDDHLTDAVLHVMQDSTKLYTGDMYRAVFFPHSTLRRLTTEKLLAYINENAPQRVSGWCKSMTGLVQVVDGLDSHLDQDGGVILKRTGTGLDVELLYDRDPCYHGDEEVLCVDADGMSIHAFGVDAIKQVYDVAKYSEFVAELKRLEEEVYSANFDC